MTARTIDNPFIHIDYMDICFDYYGVQELAEARVISRLWKEVATTHLIKRADKGLLRKVDLIIGRRESAEQYRERVATFFQITRNIHQLFYEFDLSFPHILLCTHPDTIQHLLEYPFKHISLRIHAGLPTPLNVLLINFLNVLSPNLLSLAFIYDKKVQTEGNIYAQFNLPIMLHSLTFPKLQSLVMRREEGAPEDHNLINRFTDIFKIIFSRVKGNAHAPALRTFKIKGHHPFFLRNILTPEAQICTSFWRNITEFEFTQSCGPISNTTFAVLAQSLLDLSIAGSQLTRLSLELKGPPGYITNFLEASHNLEAFFDLQSSSLIEIQINHSIMSSVFFDIPGEDLPILVRIRFAVFPNLQTFSFNGRSEIEASSQNEIRIIDPFTVVSFPFNFPFLRMFTFGGENWRLGSNFLSGTDPDQVGIEHARLDIESMTISKWANMRTLRARLQNNFNSIRSLTCPLTFLQPENGGGLAWRDSVEELHLRSVDDVISPHIAQFENLIRLFIEEDIDSTWDDGYCQYLANIGNPKLTTIILKGSSDSSILRNTLAENYPGLVIKEE